jgi:hypothetical protein
VVTRFGWLELSILVLLSKNQIGTKFDLWNQNWNWVLKWDLILQLDFFLNKFFLLDGSWLLLGGCIKKSVG